MMSNVTKGATGAMGDIKRDDFDASFLEGMMEEVKFFHSALPAFKPFNFELLKIKAKKQYNFAKERIFKNGLNEKINIQMLDYRDIKDKYNSIASIEMIEAVGQNYLKSYFKKIKESLIYNGTAAIQAITIDDKIYNRYKTKTDFIQKYIFPGGFLPCKKEILKLSNEYGLKFEKCNSYGSHYSSTLSIWRDEFLNKWEDISKQGFDNTFKKMWNFYLSYCEAGFKSKNIDLIQFSLQNK